MNSILVIEDDDAHVELIHRAFERQELIQLHTVSTLKAARAFLSSEHPHLIFLDWMLPDGKAIDLLTKDQIADGYPVVIMTSFGNEHVAVEAMKAGALDYVVKSPSAFAEMPHIAERALREWEHIAARKRAEHEAQRTAAELRAFIDSAAQGVMVTTPEGRITLINQQIEQVFGYNRQELVGALMDVLLPNQVHYANLEGKEPILDEALDIGTHTTRNMVGRRKDGSFVPLEVGISLTNNGSSTSYVALITDITERKLLEAKVIEAERMHIELEKEKELRQQKDYFLSMVSHEFRTPLAIIRSSSDILRHYTHLSPEKRDAQFDRIVDQVEQLNNMVEDILLLTRSEMKRIVYNPHKTNLAELCNRIVDIVEKSLSSHVIIATRHTDIEVVCLDEYLLEHILINLLNNAVKYSPEHTEIYFTIDTDHQTIRFQIKDKGIGIEEQDQPKIFDLFQRGRNVSTIHGTGLGLAIVKEFVQLHQGTIEVQSQVGVGTVFTVKLPLLESC